LSKRLGMIPRMSSTKMNISRATGPSASFNARSARSFTSATPARRTTNKPSSSTDASKPPMHRRTFTRIPLLGRFPKCLQLREIPVQFLLRNPSQRLGPTLPRPARTGADHERFVLNRDRGLAAKAAGVQQFIGLGQGEPVAVLFNLRLHTRNLPNSATADNHGS